MLLFAIDSGRLKTWAEAFPDPRCEPAIGMEVILPAHLAGRFAGLYSLRKTGYVLRSARVLGALGYSVEVIEPDQGLSVRGTSDDKLFSGDVVRQLLVKMEQPVDLSPCSPRPVEVPSVAVKVRERASRRAVKQVVDEAEAEIRALQFTTSKAVSLVATARAIVSEGLTAENLADLSDDEVIAQLVRIRGIGRWSAEWVLARTLGRGLRALPPWSRRSAARSRWYPWSDRPAPRSG